MGFEAEKEAEEVAVAERLEVEPALLRWKLYAEAGKGGCCDCA